MKIIIIATEASGDYLGLHLIKELKRKNKNISIEGVGGQLMESTGFESWIKISEFSTIGVFEVLIRIFKFIKLLNFVEKKIRSRDPNIIITIDSPSFNYRLIKKIQDLRKKKIKFIHYVAPTVWAWKEYRAKIFAKFYDQLFTLFKFEPKYFLKFGLSSKFVGHQIFYDKKKLIKKKNIILFLPGSRKVEIEKNLKLLRNLIKDTSSKYKDYKFFVLTFEPYKNLISKILNECDIKIVTDYKKKRNLIEQSFLAVAASGSVTLELCKYNTPMIVVYDTHHITKFIIKLFVKVKFATIINIFFKKEIVPEYIFEKFTYSNVIKSFDDLIKNKKQRNRQINFMNKFSTSMLHKSQNPSKIICDKILN